MPCGCVESAPAASARGRAGCHRRSPSRSPVALACAAASSKNAGAGGSIHFHHLSGASRRGAAARARADASEAAGSATGGRSPSRAGRRSAATPSAASAVCTAVSASREWPLHRSRRRAAKEMTVVCKCARYGDSAGLGIDRGHDVAVVDLGGLSRLTARPLARGMDRTFLCRPFSACSGSSVHTSFWSPLL